eukprot:CAMPEP_0119323064 /NCGR_PEP_ID=MMETSP1333-20130426/59872_1 /TAXON_ID=418940 /ORGANISM="Scyphosphaera apsteinii, Strain RCC1455" /LENGTH=256 /DNA_ID=CAMNT_0007330425 /DNA_START=282 /DNA_END=1052 /DNA_ORIENTATION=-
MAMLCAIDPWLLISPWDFPLADLLLPLSLEFSLLFCGFPFMVYLVNRRMATLQKVVREQLEEASHALADRGLNFQLKQGVLSNGAGTNMWIEVQIAPLLQVMTAVPVPTMYPILLPSAGTLSQSGGVPSSAAGGISGGSTDLARGEAHEPSGPARGTAGASAISSSATSVEADARAAAATGTLSPQQLEYLRVLQENQLLRQYLQQYQTLVKLQAQHAQALAAQAATISPATAVPTQPPADGASVDLNEPQCAVNG